MENVKISRVQNSDKMLRFPRTVSDNNILHRARWKNKVQSSANWNRTDGRQVGNNTHTFSEPEKRSLYSNISDGSNKCLPTRGRFSGIEMSKDELDNRGSRCVVNNAFQIEVADRNKSVLKAKRQEAELRNCLSDGEEYKPRRNTNKSFWGEMSTNSRVNKDTENNNLCDVTDEELKNLPDLNPKTKNIHHTNQQVSSSDLIRSSVENDFSHLSDVLDEELKDLPLLGTPPPPLGTHLPPQGTPSPSLGTPARVMNQNVNSKDEQINRTQQNYTPDMVVVNKNIKIRQLKRSVSSLESDDDFTSFFGSIKNRNKRDVEEETYIEPFYFNSSMSVVPGNPDSTFNRSGLTINRAYSAESFMKRRDRNEARSSIYSRNSSSEHSSFVNDDHKVENISDRLHMRRGALAEPEKMLMSQELRERTQRGVEKRKTFFRKVSQFFNLHLKLNLEEDLI